MSFRSKSVKINDDGSVSMLDDGVTWYAPFKVRSIGDFRWLDQKSSPDAYAGGGVWYAMQTEPFDEED